MGAALELAVDALAVHRLTRLATADTITEGPRRAVVEALVELKQQHRLSPDQADAVDAAEVVALTQDPPKLAQLLTCRWCAGVWVAGGVVVARRVAPRAWAPMSRMLALASAGALLAGLED